MPRQDGQLKHSQASIFLINSANINVLTVKGNTTQIIQLIMATGLCSKNKKLKNFFLIVDWLNARELLQQFEDLDKTSLASLL